MNHKLKTYKRRFGIWLVHLAIVSMKPITILTIQTAVTGLLFGGVWLAGLFPWNICLRLAGGTLLIAVGMSLWKEFK